MKYIRTKDGVYEVVDTYEVSYVIGYTEDGFDKKVYKEDVIKQADTIEELCDEFVLVEKIREVTYHHKSSTFADFKSIAMLNERYTLYGAIWASKGLIYVAKMNENGDLVLI